MEINYYQSIPKLNIKGRMNTQEEFDKIGLPKDLKGKTVLDIGCNIGAFLLECYDRGASWLEGVEVDREWRWLAIGMLNEHTNPMFNVCDNVNQVMEKFDLVLLLSITHVAEGISGQKLLDKAYSLVNKGGLLIVEINDRLQVEKLKLPEGAVFFGKNKDNRSVYHIKK